MSTEKDDNRADYEFINESLVYAYDTIMRIEEKYIKSSRFKDISARELHLIHAIGLHDRKTISQVAKILKLSRGTLTTNLDRLEKKGYVKRIPNEQDRRVFNLALTNKGKLLYRAHDAFHSKLVKTFLKDSNPKEIKKVLQNLMDFIDEVSAKWVIICK